MKNKWLIGGLVGGVSILCLCCLCVMSLIWIAGQDDSDMGSDPDKITTTTRRNETSSGEDESATEDIVADDSSTDASNGDLNFVICDNQGSTFKKPANWYKHEENSVSAGGESCFITKEEIVGVGSQFQTGFTATKIESVSTVYFSHPSVFAETFINTVGDNEIVTDSDPVKTVVSGNLVSYYRFVETSTSRQYYGVFANDSTDSAYVVIFEAPKSEFEDIWDEAGEEMIQSLGLSF